jgi:hypothetical protein
LGEATDSAGRPRRGWLGRIVKLAMWLVLLALLGVGALLLRLSQGPLSLDFLTDRVVRALEPADGSFRVSIGATELVWTDRWYDVDLRARDVACRDTSGATLVGVSSLAMELSVPALLHGELAPREIELAEPQLSLVREPDGDIDFGLGGGATSAGGESVFAKLFAGATPDGGAAPAARFLTSIVIRDGRLSLLDRRSGFTTQADAVSVDMSRVADTLDVRAGTAIAIAGERIPLHATVTRRAAEGGTTIELAFSDLEPAAALQTAHMLEPAAGSVAASVLETAAYLRLPLAGKITAELDPGDEVRTVQLAGCATRGVIALPPPFGDPLAIERIALDARYEAATDTVELAQLAIDLGAPEVRVTGRWSGKEQGVLHADATLSGLPTNELARYWPPTAAVSARTWVTRNITSGTVREASVSLDATLAPSASPPAFTLGKLAGKLAFAGLSVRYVDSMPPASAIVGSGTFSTDGFDFKVTSAKVANVAVPSAAVVIAGFQRKITTIAIDAQARGTIRDALLIVDAEPLRYAPRIGIAPDTTTGTTTARVKLGFPLDGAPIPPDLGVAVEAQLRGAGFPNAVKDFALSDGALDLRVGGDALAIDGSARLAGVPCDVTWRETLGAKTGVARTIDVRSTVDSDGRAALGFDLRPWLTGPAGVTAHLEQRADGKGSGSVGIDLTSATLDAPRLRLVKQPGAGSRADLTLVLAGGRLTAISAFTFQAPGASAHGKTTLGTGAQRFATLDLDGVLPPAAPRDPSPQFTLDLTPAAQGNAFVLTSNDASTLLRLLLPDVQTQGGRMKFTGTADLEAAGLPFSGDIVVRSFKLTHSPVLARLLMLSSLDGLVGTMQGQGLSFDSLTSNIAHTLTTVTFKDGVADGPSVRLVWNGSIDSEKDDVSIDGTLVPSFYGLNTAAAKVPLIGGLFGGGDGEGVIAIDFTVRGPVKDPKVGVKPLSSIAPGVLRSLARRVPW